MRFHAYKMYVVTVAATVLATISGVSGNLRACVALGVVAFLLVQWLTVRTVVDRRRRAFSRRLPWFRAHRATTPIDPARIEVERFVETSKGKETITFRVNSPDVVLADGMEEAQANELAAELRAFLATSDSRP